MEPSRRRVGTEGGEEKIQVCRLAAEGTPVPQHLFARPDWDAESELLSQAHPGLADLHVCSAEVRALYWSLTLPSLWVPRAWFPWTTCT